MSDNLFSPFLEPVKNSFKKFTKKHTGLTKWISWTMFGVILLTVFYSANKELKIISFSEKTEKELAIDWLDENFTDTTYNVLLLPFNDYQDSSEKILKIERALEQRLDDLRNKYLFNSDVKSLIKIKYYVEIPEFLSPDSIIAIGNGVNADIVIYGDLYDIYDKPAKKTNIKYIILHQPGGRSTFEVRGKTGEIIFNSLHKIREGSNIKNIDHLTLWLFCNEQLYYKNIDNAITIWNSIESDFKESRYRKSNGYLCGLIGENYLHSLNLIDAKNFFKKSMIYYEYGEVFSLIGLVYQALSKMDSSKIMQLKALQILPNSLMVNVNLGVLYKSLGNSDSAKYFYLKSLSINPKSSAAHHNLGSLYRTEFNQFDSAETHLRLSIKYNPREYRTYRELGQLYFHNYQLYDSALTLYRYAINLNPSFADPYFQIGTIYMNEIYCDYDSSEVYFLKTIKLDPDYWWAYFSLGSIYHRFLSKSELAEKYYLKTLEFKPDTSQVHINYAFLLLEKLGDKKKAKEHYLRAIQLQPGLKTKYRDTIFGVKNN